MDTSTVQPDVTPEIFRSTRSNTKISDSRQIRSSATEAETDPFCKRISKHLSHGKALQHKTDLFTHIRGLLYKHITDSGKKFLVDFRTSQKQNLNLLGDQLLPVSNMASSRSEENVDLKHFQHH